MKLAVTPRFFENNTEQLLGIEKKYYPFFTKHGHNIHLIPFMGIKIGEYFDDLKPDGIVFAGGYRLYTDEIRKLETEVLKESLNRKLPILAICCGMWTVNYYFGGTLKVDESHQAFDGQKIDVKKYIHPVDAIDFIKKGPYKVNSYHSKVIEKVGEGMETFIVANDGTVEGFYNLEKRIIGIQFHMENRGVSGSLTRQLMGKFLQL